MMGNEVLSLHRTDLTYPNEYLPTGKLVLNLKIPIGIFVHAKSGANQREDIKEIRTPV